MNKKIEPISVEKTDNSDGSYIKKYVYDKFPDIFFEYLSKIEFYTPENIIQKCEYYSDDKFINLLAKETREYNADGSYIGKTILTAPNDDGCLSNITKCDLNDKIIEGYAYSDINFKNLLGKLFIQYNLDNSYTMRITHTTPNEYECLSEIVVLDPNDKILKATEYEDNNFTILKLNIVWEYNADGSQIRKYVWIETNENGWLSELAEYDSNDKYLGGKYYTDNNFTDLGLTETREYNPDGSYVRKWIYSKPNDDGWLSEIENYDSNDKYLGSSYYTDNNFTELGQKVICEYNPDDSYVRKWICSKPNDDGWLSVIENYDSNDKYLGSSYYTDNNFTELGLKVIYEYNPDDSYVKKWIYPKPNKNGWLSELAEYDSNDKYLGGKYYTDNNFTDLDQTIIREYNTDGSYVKKWIYTEPNENGLMSVICEYDSNDKYLGAKYYTDNNFTDLDQTIIREYNTDGSYIKKYVYPQNDEFKFKKETYDINNKIKTIEFYNDINGKELVAKDFYSYKNSKQIIKSVFEKPYNNFQSSIEIKEGNMLKKTIAYSDRNFKETLRVQYFKHFKDNSYIRLREYKKPQDKILAEITKFDKDKKILYTKQYKFKGLLAKILFWLAK